VARDSGVTTEKHLTPGATATEGTVEVGPARGKVPLGHSWALRRGGAQKPRLVPTSLG
jgi:hypothetical protein